MVEFREDATLLEVDSEVVIESYADKPLGFSIDPRAKDFPFQYDAGERADLAPYLQPLFTQEVRPFQDWVDGFWRPGQTLPTLDLVDRMNRTIPAELAYGRREEPGVQRPSDTLRRGSGSCRDLATLLMEACRHLGLAARFVGGYRHDPRLKPGEGSTHAWCEVYLTGAGWLGFDATSGERVGGDHIAVAVARHPEWIPPVSGSYVGQPKSTMEVEVEVGELS